MRGRSEERGEELRLELAAAMGAAGIDSATLAFLAGTTVEAVWHWQAGRRDVPGYALTILDLYRRLPRRERVLALARAGEKNPRAA